jgi:hypothetical protein
MIMEKNFANFVFFNSQYFNLEIKNSKKDANSWDDVTVISILELKYKPF